MPLAEYLVKLKDAGLATLPGTAAEILDDEVRAIICPDKVNTEEWLDAHRTAHSVGLRSNVTIMFGTVERPVHVARHMVRTRTLQKETGGPQLAFRIAMGVRASDQNWKRQLNRLIAENQADINHLLLTFGVPLIDERDRPIADDVRAR